MTDFIVIYDVNHGWSRINELHVANIVKVYGEDARIHIYGVPDTTYDHSYKPKCLMSFFSTCKFDQAIFTDSDCIINKKLDIFNYDFDVGLTWRYLKHTYSFKEYPLHHYFNSGVLFLRPSAEPFIRAWVMKTEKRDEQNIAVRAIDQCALNEVALSGKWDLRGRNAYEQGLTAGITYENVGVKIRVFNCLAYNRSSSTLKKDAFIWHFVNDSTTGEIEANMARGIGQSET